MVGVMALFSAAYTMVRTGAGDSGGFEEKMALHQCSVLSPLLFSIVMDVVMKEARSGLPGKLLYADDLVLMITTKEELRRKLVEWRASFVVKRLKVNAGTES